MRKITRVVLAPLLALVIFSFTFAGCAAFISKLPIVISAVTDGMLVLDTIEAFSHAYFTVHPDAAKSAQVDALIAKSRTALDAALRIANASTELDQAQVDAAFTDFKAAYTELIALVESIGIKASGTRLQATPGGLVVPQPLAFTIKVS